MNTEKEKRAIKILQQFEPQTEPYYLCYSGGKDSDTIKLLAGLAGVKFEAVHNLTTADAPETVYYIRSQSDVRIDHPSTTMWDLIPKKENPADKSHSLLLRGFEREEGARARKNHRRSLG